MNARTSALLLYALALHAHADNIAMEDQTQILTDAANPASRQYFQPPKLSELPDNAFGMLVQEGRAIFVDTKTYAPEYVGNSLACGNCHLEQGRKANSAPLWAAYAMYPAYRKKNDKVNSYAERLQGCFQFGMNGKAPDANGPVIAALTAYSIGSQPVHQ
jgi:thiosulfate dehydrogenase